MSWRVRLPSKPQTFAILMALAALTSVLPRSCTSWKSGLVQPLGPLQQPLGAATRAAQDVAQDLVARPLSPQDAERLRTENDELRRLLDQQGLRLDELRARMEELAAVRNQLHDSNARILVAPVVSIDADRRRHTLRIGKGASHGVPKDAWVAAGVPRDDWPDDMTNRQVLLRQWLIGRIDATDTLYSTVRLTTDPGFRAPVIAIRELPDGTWQASDWPAVLLGMGRDRAGRERMLISEATRNFYEQGYRLAAAPLSRDLPDRMLIGRIDSARLVDNAPNHFNLDVSPIADVSKLRYVYVICVAP